MKIDFSKFHESEYQYDDSIYGVITLNDGGVQKDIDVEICPDDDEKIADSSKDELQFFVDNYEKFREVYLEALLCYYEGHRATLGIAGEETVDGYPYITTVEQLLKTVDFNGLKVHSEKKDGHHAIGVFFDTTWDPEHGAGVLMAGFAVLDTGNQDHAALPYALHRK
ncbi:MAG: hypothetical protein IK130_10005 [Oscillospiraceae bacterium]|nr:hypothetical protein [Oscillospiraceae bacterium]